MNLIIPKKILSTQAHTKDQVNITSPLAAHNFNPGMIVINQNVARHYSICPFALVCVYIWVNKKKAVK